MKPCARPKFCSGSLRHRITIERRTLGASSPGSAEAQYGYETKHTCRANIKTKGGVSEFSKIEINGTSVSHVLTIRHTNTSIDIRDRVRDMAGNLYSILSIENQGEFNDYLVLYCARQGSEDVRAVL
jgi:hypothetical protein